MRTGFKRGGFPVCSWYMKRGFTVPFEARPNVQRLLPLVSEGLLAV